MWIQHLIDIILILDDNSIIIVIATGSIWSWGPIIEITSKWSKTMIKGLWFSHWFFIHFEFLLINELLYSIRNTLRITLTWPTTTLLRCLIWPCYWCNWTWLSFAFISWVRNLLQFIFNIVTNLLIWCLIAWIIKTILKICLWIAIRLSIRILGFTESK